MSAIEYLRAHGNVSGPLQRPILTGLICGALGTIPAIPVVWYSGAVGSVARALGVSSWFGLCLMWIVMAGAGALYGAIFRRAANDRRGGWLFGLSYGFLF